MTETPHMLTLVLPSGPEGWLPPQVLEEHSFCGLFSFQKASTPGHKQPLKRVGRCFFVSVFFLIIFKVLCQLLDHSWLPYCFFFLVKRYDCPPLIEQLKHGLPLEKIYISTLYSSPVIVTSIFHIDECLWSALRLWITPKTLLKIPSLPQLPAEFRLNSIQIEFNTFGVWHLCF